MIDIHITINSTLRVYYLYDRALCCHINVLVVSLCMRCCWTFWNSCALRDHRNWINMTSYSSSIIHHYSYKLVWKFRVFNFQTFCQHRHKYQHAWGYYHNNIYIDTCCCTYTSYLYVLVQETNCPHPYRCNWLCFALLSVFLWVPASRRGNTCRYKPVTTVGAETLLPHENQNMNVICWRPLATRDVHKCRARCDEGQEALRSNRG